MARFEMSCRGLLGLDCVLLGCLTGGGGGGLLGPFDLFGGIGFGTADT